MEGIHVIQNVSIVGRYEYCFREVRKSNSENILLHFFFFQLYLAVELTSFLILVKIPFYLETVENLWQVWAAAAVFI